MINKPDGKRVLITGAAAGVVDAVRHGRSLALAGPLAKSMYHLRRLSRKLAQRPMLNDARKAGHS